MKVDVGWYRDSDRVILMHFQEQCTWGEMHHAKEEADALMDTVDHDCALVLWFPPMVLPLADMLSNGRSILSRRHSHAERFIFVSESSLVRSMASVLSQITGPRSNLIEVTTTMSEADQRLEAAGYFIVA